jgi:hypothetical protein
LIRGRGIGYLREASPLFDSPLVLTPFQGEGEIIEEGLTLARGDSVDPSLTA